MLNDCKNRLPLTIPAGPGRPQRTRAKHGLYSWVNSKRLPQGRAFAKTRRELGQLRTEVVNRHGGEKIAPEALGLIDNLVEVLGMQKLLGLYIKQFRILDNPSAKRGRLELSPLLSKSWATYANVVRQEILALEAVKTSKVEDPVITIGEYVAEFDRRTTQAADAACDAARGGTGRRGDRVILAALGRRQKANQGPREVRGGGG